MGAKDGFADQQPAHRVTLSAYWIDRTEVTTAQYNACVRAGKCTPGGDTVDTPETDESDRKILSGLCNGSVAERSDHPINCVNWEQAATFCAWAGKRLPTEAEWEYASRGPEGWKYPWGNEAPDPTRLNAADASCIRTYEQLGKRTMPMLTGDDGWGATAPVGSYPKGRSSFGLDDMAGNVWEWAGDWYSETTYAKDRKGAVDPTGPSKGDKRVIRGGSWFGSPTASVRSSNRGRQVPGAKDVVIGFRCAKSGH
jgi:formylglycine-generating enzyme required for sulfatase activity